MQKSIITLAILTGLAPLNVDAGKVTVDTVLDASLVQQQYNLATSDDFEVNTLEIVPTVALQYAAKKAQVNASASHVQQRASFNNDNPSLTRNFTQYSVQSQLTLIERLLIATADYSQNYNSFNPNQFLIDDFLLQADQLDKVERTRFGLVSNIIQGEYFGGQASLNRSSFNTISDIVGNSRESDSNQLSVNLYSGSDVNYYNWSVNYSKNKTDQFRGDAFTSEFVQANAGFKIFGDLGLSLTAQDESNSLSNELLTQSNDRNFSSVGAGVSYSPSFNRSLAIYYNKPSSSASDNDGFVSGTINWAFSPRTIFSANASKRYYGRSSNASLTFNNRAVRIEAGRNESVSSNAQLFIDGNTTTSLVCSVGAVNLGDCFLPDTLDYQLGVGESFINFQQPNFALGDNIVVRKQNYLNVSYQKRKLTFNLNAYDNQDLNEGDININTQLDTQTVSAGVDYKIGVYSALSLSHSRADMQSFTLDTETGEGSTKRTDISFEREFGRDLVLSFKLSNIARMGFLPGFININNEDFTDRRVTVSIRYQITSAK